MRPALGQLLVDAGAVTGTELAAALRQQVLYGARLGTNLIELGAAGHDGVALALARMHQVPAALSSHLERVDPRARERVPAALCTDLVALPLAFTTGDRLVVCMRDPADRGQVAQLRRAAGLEVIPAACPELSLYRLLHHYCEMRPPARVASVPGGEPRPAPPALFEGAPPMPALLGDAPAEAAAPSLQAMATSLVRLLEGELEPEPRPEPEPEPEIAPPAEPPPAAPELSLIGAIERMARAAHRSEVADAMLAFARPRFDACVVFDVRGAVARGYRGLGLAQPEKLELPLDVASPFAAASDARRRIADPNRREPGGELIEGLLRELGAPHWPDTMIIEPVEIGARLVNLIYFHRLDGRPGADLWQQLSTLSAACSNALLRLVRARRRTTVVPTGE